MKSKPVISKTNDYIYLGCVNAYVFKISLKTGNIMWKYKTNGAITHMYVSRTNIIIITDNKHSIFFIK
jgi:glucose dehydrogenase